MAETAEIEDVEYHDDTPTWICERCGHRTYEHSTRREVNSGRRSYAHCQVPGCKCPRGENRVYPKGLIDS